MPGRYRDRTANAETQNALCAGEGRFLDVGRVHGQLPVPGHEIQGGKVLGAMQGVEGIVDPGQGVVVDFGLVIELTVVDTKTVGTILFPYNYHRA